MSLEVNRQTLTPSLENRHDLVTSKLHSLVDSRINAAVTSIADGSFSLIPEDLIEDLYMGSVEDLRSMVVRTSIFSADDFISNIGLGGYTPTYIRIQWLANT